MSEQETAFDLTQLHFDDLAIARLRSILATYGNGPDPGIGLGLSRDREIRRRRVLLHVGIYTRSQAPDLETIPWIVVGDLKLAPLFSEREGIELEGKTVTSDENGQLSVALE